MKLENIEEMVDKSYAEKSCAEISKAPLSALKGISMDTAEKLAKAFGIDTVEKMAKLKYYDWALEIKTRAEKQ
ncbi:MAG: hypothetical protein EOM30_07995 [Clostridia bacterium]|nr:hypothetical protein [Clostridia bacterium]NLS85375.1 hypothetical protein [Oscillospiraceae bacterium]